MLKNRFVLAVAFLSTLMVTLAVSSSFSRQPESVDLSAPSGPVIIPVERPNNLAAYHQSERNILDPNVGLAIYQRSERTLIDPQVGLAIYRLSERTYRPSRDLQPFSPYQRSEWFGR